MYGWLAAVVAVGLLTRAACLVDLGEGAAHQVPQGECDWRCDAVVAVGPLTRAPGVADEEGAAPVPQGRLMMMNVLD